MASVVDSPALPPELADMLKSIVGMTITTRFIGKGNRFSIGFGIVSKKTTVDHGEWEIGTYDCAWRVLKDGAIIVASDDAVESQQDLLDIFESCNIGEFVGLHHLTALDTRFTFSRGCIDILCSISDDDQILHIFFPESVVAIFSISKGWVLGRSDKPWV